ncbi:hypothetical protein THRCLA_00627 [Thraustotheca clavata]|uniref:Mitochondrial Carrier (MC) Family n=1 Tax=Thraustotheca clavata TaxID=74557 RepID=A0A1W0AB11_9STRA|nr:hypothetical protein THRCLA_00627 [Thraustotheca clavata]
MVNQVNEVWWHQPAIDFIAGSIGGFAAKFVEFPFDTIKVQLQTSKKEGRVSAFRQMKTLVVNEGPTALYRGLPLPLMGTVMESAGLFMTMGQVKHYLYGSNSHDLTPSQVGVAGGITGFFISFLLNPIELIKCRMQVSTSSQQMQYRNSADCLAKSIRHEGIGVLYRGFGSTMLREIPGTAAWFTTYETTLQYLRKRSNKQSQWDIIMAGAMSGMAYSVAFYPADTVKSYIQTHSCTNMSMMSVTKDIFRQHGLIGFYRGLAPTIVRAVPANAVLFYCYEGINSFCQDLMHGNQPTQKLVLTIILAHLLFHSPNRMETNSDDTTSIKYIAGAVCAGVFGGGFFLGIRRQKADAIEQAALETKDMKDQPSSSSQIKPKTFSWWERALGLHKPLTPGGAAFKALLGGSILAVTGSAVFFTTLFNVADEKTIDSFNSTMNRVFPSFRHGVIRVFGITPKPGPTPAQLQQEDEEWAIVEKEMATPPSNEAKDN